MHGRRSAKHLCILKLHDMPLHNVLQIGAYHVINAIAHHVSHRSWAKYALFNHCAGSTTDFDLNMISVLHLACHGLNLRRASSSGKIYQKKSLLCPARAGWISGIYVFCLQIYQVLVNLILRLFDGRKHKLVSYCLFKISMWRCWRLADQDIYNK